MLLLHGKMAEFSTFNLTPPSSKVIDDGEHRINWCCKWESVNRYHNDVKVTFCDIYSDDMDKCLEVVNAILSIWDLANGKNDIRKADM